MATIIKYTFSVANGIAKLANSMLQENRKDKKR